MDLPKQLQCFVANRDSLENIYWYAKYQPGEEFTCKWVTAHLFDLNILGKQKQEILLIWLLGLLLLSNDSGTCVCEGCLCDVNIFRTLLFWTYCTKLKGQTIQT